MKLKRCHNPNGSGGALIGLSICLSIFICIAALSPSAFGQEVAVTVTDYTGRSVTIDKPVEKIVSLSSSGSEIICALGAGDRIVGRGESSLFPPSLAEVAVMGKSSLSPDLELIVEQDPDLVIADTMLKDDARTSLENAGIPVLEESFVDPPRVIEVAGHLGTILDEEERAADLVDFLERFQRIIEDNVSGLGPDERPDVFLEREWVYHTASAGTSSHNLVVFAGGDNIAGDEEIEYPTVSPEWVVESDPDVIVKLAWSTTGETSTEEELAAVRDEILSRPELANVKAVRDGRVHVLNSKANSGLRSIIGELYLAKWFHPQLFEDVDPEEVHQDMIRRFFDLDIEGAYAYP
ncbi:MAG TPA: ABC transporter substrate-binding protein [Methanothrix sp.]|nr:ABC transporter substrate-binding protein [Methanothrix sp.]